MPINVGSAIESVSKKKLSSVNFSKTKGIIVFFWILQENFVGCYRTKTKIIICKK